VGLIERRGETLWEGRFLRMSRREGWECVDRPFVSGLVGIVPLTLDHQLVLIEQYRPPVGGWCVELPAGAAGDGPGRLGEALVIAAQRELLEETGFEGDSWAELIEGATSPGLTSERMTWFLARGLRRVQAGGGDEHEQIRVTPVPLSSVPGHLESRRGAGLVIDLKIYAALYALSRVMAAEGR